MNQPDYKAQAKGVLIFLAVGAIGHWAPSVVFWVVMIAIAILGLPSLAAATLGPLRRRRRVQKKNRGQEDKPWTTTGL